MEILAIKILMNKSIIIFVMKQVKLNFGIGEGIAEMN